jgi:hypothetical protein
MQESHVLCDFRNAMWLYVDASKEATYCVMFHDNTMFFYLYEYVEGMSRSIKLA